MSQDLREEDMYFTISRSDQHVLQLDFPFYFKVISLFQDGELDDNVNYGKVTTNVSHGVVTPNISSTPNVSYGEVTPNISYGTLTTKVSFNDTSCSGTYIYVIK